MSAFLASEVKKAVEPKEKIATVIDAQLKFFDRHRELFKIYVNETGGFEWNITAKMGKTVMDWYEEHLKFTSSIFEQGIEKGEFLAIKPMYLTLALQGIINSFVTHWIQNTPGSSLIESAPIIKEIFFQSTLLEQVKV